MNEVPMYLTLWTSLNKLATIRLHGQPEIASPHDLTGQHMPSHMQLWTRIFHMRPHSIGETRFLFVKN